MLLWEIACIHGSPCFFSPAVQGNRLCCAWPWKGGAGLYPRQWWRGSEIHCAQVWGWWRSGTGHVQHGPGRQTGMHINTIFAQCECPLCFSLFLQSIRDFAHSSFQFALQKAWPLYMRYVTMEDLSCALSLLQSRYALCIIGCHLLHTVFFSLSPAQRIPFWRNMMAGLRTSLKRSMRSENTPLPFPSSHCQFFVLLTRCFHC